MSNDLFKNLASAADKINKSAGRRPNLEAERVIGGSALVPFLGGALVGAQVASGNHGEERELLRAEKERRQAEALADLEYQLGVVGGAGGGSKVQSIYDTLQGQHQQDAFRRLTGEDIYRSAQDTEQQLTFQDLLRLGLQQGR